MEDGVEVIINPTEPYKIIGELSNLHLEEEFTIDLERQDVMETGLNYASFFDVDSRGNIYLAKRASKGNFIFKFDRHGVFVSSFARFGQGPGELDRCEYIEISEKDEIITISEGRMRLLFFNCEGSLIKEIPIKLNFRKIYPLQNGNYLVHRQLFHISLKYMDQYQLLLCTPEFEMIKEIDRYYRPNPVYMKKKAGIWVNVWKNSEKYIFVGNDNRGYEIRVHDLDGNLARKIKKKYVPVKFPEEFKERFKKPLKSQIGKQVRKNTSIPKHMPPLANFFFDDEGHLFVMTYETGKNKREFIHDMFDPEGIFTGRISLGNYDFMKDYWGMQPMDAIAKNSRLYCLRRKESEHKELVVYRMRWE